MAAGLPVAMGQEVLAQVAAQATAMNRRPYTQGMRARPVAALGSTAKVHLGLEARTTAQEAPAALAALLMASRPMGVVLAAAAAVVVATSTLIALTPMKVATAEVALSA
jgi:uncharacterized protein (DUF2345 family)